MSGQMDIHVETSDVMSLGAQVAQKYALIEDRFNNIVEKGQELSPSWDSDGGAAYQTAIVALKGEFDKFCTKYANVMTSLSNFTSAYDAEQAAMKAAIQSRTQTHPGGGGPHDAMVDLVQ